MHGAVGRPRRPLLICTSSRSFAQSVRGVQDRLSYALFRLVAESQILHRRCSY